MAVSLKAKHLGSCTCCTPLTPREMRRQVRSRGKRDVRREITQGRRDYADAR